MMKREMILSLKRKSERNDEQELFFFNYHLDLEKYYGGIVNVENWNSLMFVIIASML